MAVEKKMHNPKIHAPSVYIPNWLIQVPSNLVSFAAKILYGRLSQWANNKGSVHRTVKQLAQEIGCEPRAIDRYLKELRDCELIGTFQPVKGGANHFHFYEHEWMNEAINPNLIYTNTEYSPHVKIDVTPTSDLSLPHVKSVVPKIKEIIINNNDKEKINKKESFDAQPDDYQETYFPSPENITQHLSEQTESDETFEVFWQLYPVKKGKQRAKVAWFAQRCYKDVHMILTKLDEQVRRDRQFLEGYPPHPTTYIHGKRWEDEISPVVVHAPSNQKPKNNPNWADDLHLDLI